MTANTSREKVVPVCILWHLHGHHCLDSQKGIVIAIVMLYRNMSYWPEEGEVEALHYRKWTLVLNIVDLPLCL